MSERVLELIREINPERVEHTTEEELATVLSMIEERRSAVDTTTRKETGRSERIAPAGRPRRSAWLVAAGAAAVVLLAIGGVAWLLSGGDGVDPADEVTPPTTVEVTTTATADPGTTTAAPATTTATTEAPTTTTAAPPTTLPPPTAGSWTRVPDLAPFEGAFVDDIVAHGSGFVAFGKTGPGSTPQAWTSPDGLEWTAVAIESEQFVAAAWLLPAGDRVYALANGPMLGNVTPPAVFVSSDGSSWSEVETSGFEIGDRIESAIAFDGTLIAIGGDGANDFVQWTSTDGVTWGRSGDEWPVFAGSVVTDMTLGGPGIVAAGATGRGGNDDAVVWTSVDGTGWSRVEDDEFGGPGNQWIAGIASGPSGFVAVGASWVEDVGVEGAVWTSSDGLSWERIADDGVFAGIHLPTGERSATIEAVAAVGSGFIAAGTAMGPDGEMRDLGTIWISPDGDSWSRLDAAEVDVRAGYLTLVAPGVESVVVAGQSETGTGMDMVLWRP